MVSGWSGGWAGVENSTRLKRKECMIVGVGPTLLGFGSLQILKVALGETQNALGPCSTARGGSGLVIAIFVLSVQGGLRVPPF